MRAWEGKIEKAGQSLGTRLYLEICANCPQWSSLIRLLHVSLITDFMTNPVFHPSHCISVYSAPAAKYWLLHIPLDLYRPLSTSLILYQAQLPVTASHMIISLPHWCSIAICHVSKILVDMILMWPLIFALHQETSVLLLQHLTDLDEAYLQTQQTLVSFKIVGILELTSLFWSNENNFHLLKPFCKPHAIFVFPVLFCWPLD